ncbi:hypothetical protein ASPZODRAFT_19316 [Penicilliopsis zonata CBS 506.65]|uniref:5-oxoprolinase n=1 Tax=Penicilliopsis zonata CBS 506.65 TaxID=1073090 RepID=A0A1L9S8X4_9EURO|nr:hypothetical protein ASPZODRAFT_19316 [Penicilliopsis zonata CBS 506.65]OJJ43594.1 hypothetical protein ASPZODRAFT_19316 [Penicilliopsis zonata CBS 506.65]
MHGIRISIDRGGTFCDVIAQTSDVHVFKLLSVDPQNYRDAPTEAIRRVLEIVEGRCIPKDELLDASSIGSCRIGTTVATNALLEHKGARFALLTTRGFRDLSEIGDQSRPKLFDLNIRKPSLLFDTVVEIDERVTPEGYELDPAPVQTDWRDNNDPDLVHTASGEVIRIIRRLDEDQTRSVLRDLRKQGFTAVAIAFLHSHLYQEHERLAGRIAEEEGFTVSLSSIISPRIKILERTTAVCTDAYLSPVVRQYVDNFLAGFKCPPRRIDFIASDGGLRLAPGYTGNAALLSGPAGGVVGVARACYDEETRTPLIGFDMGGTSTDVSRFDGRFDHVQGATIAGRRIAAPMLNIATVAAGGGSMLFIRNGLLVVGPESAGAHPGPACYRKSGPLTVTDANLFLGRLDVTSFPAIFGEDANQPLDRDVVEKKFTELAEEVDLSPVQLAAGFIQVANESMCRPIRNETEGRGFLTADHHLVSFGGAGGQHACSIASNLGINRILIHRYASLLSAYGISLAETTAEMTEPSSLTLSHHNTHNDETMSLLREREKELQARLETELCSQGVTDKESIVYTTFLNLQYRGMDTSLAVEEPENGDYSAAFTAQHLREFAFTTPRDIVVDSIRVRAVARRPREGVRINQSIALAKANTVSATPERQQRVYLDDDWHDVPVYRLSSLAVGAQIKGPALIADETQTILVESRYEAIITEEHVVIDRGEEAKVDSQETGVSPVLLSCFANRFMAIAEQMGHTLQRTSISTSIKERLDFSCALFAPDGGLVANAPHIPVHLGSMQFAIQYQHERWKDDLQPGDVLLTNHPEAGGTHLPDLTVVTPAFYNGEIIFYVASRGHHTDIGGIGITSMVPDSTELWQEGMMVHSARIVRGGVFLEDEVRALFAKAAEYPGCSATRRLGDNLSDIRAKIAANQRGIRLLQQLCDEFGLPRVHTAMEGIQRTAETAIRTLLKKMYHNTRLAQPLTASDFFDDGTEIKVAITLDEEGGALFDFTGTGAQTYGNMNMPISITHSAIIYVLRCLVDMEIPLNQGCLNPCTIRVPEGSILNPSPSVAICGSTIASQRITDVLLKALNAAADSQGCANSLGWGMGGKDPRIGQVIPGWNYSETVGGGSGAGPSWHGVSGVNVHATNTRATDPEVVERRTPVIITRDEINLHSGGEGLFRGGNGITREVQARIPLTFSILSERRATRPSGLAGGQPGKAGVNYVFRRNEHGKEEKINIGGKAVIKLKAGERIQINSPGGGGWGVPQ